MQGELKHLLIAVAVIAIMGYVTYVARPIVTNTVTRVVNDLL